MTNLLAPQLRLARRLPPFLAAALYGLWEHRALPKDASRAKAAEWLHHACARALPTIHVNVLPAGVMPARGLIVSNHLSYLDILVLSACLPCVFVSKAEVERWPVFGTYARWAGSVFIRRHDKSDVARANASIAQILQSDVPVVLFPEGTTTNGQQLLRFHATMLQPAIDVGSAVTPCAIVYELDDGDPGNEVSWWGDMSLLPHVLNLMGKKNIGARVAFGKPLVASGDRKQLSLELHQQVAVLRQDLQSKMVAANGELVHSSSL